MGIARAAEEESSNIADKGRKASSLLVVLVMFVEHVTLGVGLVARLVRRVQT
jgi:hypothetical protein